MHNARIYHRSIAHTVHRCTYPHTHTHTHCTVAPHVKGVVQVDWHWSNVLFSRRWTWRLGPYRKSSQISFYRELLLLGMYRSRLGCETVTPTNHPLPLPRDHFGLLPSYKFIYELFHVKNSKLKRDASSGGVLAKYNTNAGNPTKKWHNS